MIAPENTAQRARRRRGETAYRSGLAAEDQVAAHYERYGHRIVDTRWRGSGGEIDLIVQKGDALVFVEVKRARNLHEAAFRLTSRQLRRLYDAASEYLGGQPLGLATPARFDLALVGGAGDIEVIENVMVA